MGDAEVGRLLTSQELVIASHNPGKVREIAALLSNFKVQAVSAADLGLAEPQETGGSFHANAKIKAQAAARGSQRPALADDSGLVVSALNGSPGVLSARWAGPNRDFSMAMARVQRALSGCEDRRAYFACILCVAWPDGHSETFSGRVDGLLVWPPRGTKGFGYDPMFQPDGYQMTFGEMDPVAKHQISHRARAFKELTSSVFGYGDGTRY